MFSAADYGIDVVEVWPENWKAWTLFCGVSRQWRMGMQTSMGGSISIPVALDYCAVYPLLDRIASDNDEWLELFADLQVLESAALERISENAKD